MKKKSYKINENIYGKKYINESINEFINCAKISYKAGEITIEGENDLDEIFNELMNYVLYIQNEQI